MSVLDQAPLWEPEHADYRESFRTFLAREVLPAYRGWTEIPRALLQTTGEHGFLGMGIPEEQGGAGVDDPRFGAVIAQEAMLAQAPGVALTLSAHSDVAVPALLRAGLADASLATGERLVAVAEGDFTLDGERLSGRAALVVAAAFADAFLVTAGDDLALVDAGPVAVEDVGPAVGIDPAGLARVVADGAAAEVLPGAAAAAATDRALSLAVAGLAGARAAMATTIEYVTDRRAFGQPIGAFRNTRRTLATLAAEAEMADAWLERALRRAVAGTLDATTAQSGKLFCTELLGRTVDAGLQFHGGYGYIMEYDIAHAYADARLLRLLGAPTQRAQDAIGAALFSRPAT